MLSCYVEPYVRYTATVSAATSVGKGEPVTIDFYSMEGSMFLA